MTFTKDGNKVIFTRKYKGNIVKGVAICNEEKDDFDIEE